MLDSIYKAINSALEWIWECILWLPQYVVNDVLTGISAWFATLEAPDFVANIASYSGGIPPSVVYFLSIMEFKFGVQVFLAALIARFLVRRIPVIG